MAEAGVDLATVRAERAERALAGHARTRGLSLAADARADSDLVHLAERLLALEAETPTHEDGGKGRQHHDVEPTDLDQHQDHQVPEEGEVMRSIEYDQAGDTDAGMPLEVSGQRNVRRCDFYVARDT